MAKQRKQRLLFNLAPGVTVTARKRTPPREGGSEAYQRARATLLAGQVRALERAIASGVVSSLPGTSQDAQSAVTAIALQQQLTDASITASSIPLLQKHVAELAKRLSTIEKRWADIKIQARKVLGEIERRRQLTSRQLTQKLRGAKTPIDQQTITTLAANAKMQLNAQITQLQNTVQEKNTQLSAEMNETEKALLEKKMELEKALQARNQALTIQQQLQELQGLQQPSPPPAKRRRRQRQQRGQQQRGQQQRPKRAKPIRSPRR